jgi:hypothetical protein
MTAPAGSAAKAAVARTCRIAADPPLGCHRVVCAGPFPSVTAWLQACPQYTPRPGDRYWEKIKGWSIRQQEQDPRQPLFAGIEQVVHQVLLNPGAAGRQAIEDRSMNAGSSWSTRLTATFSIRVTEAGLDLSSQTPFAEKSAGAQNRDHSLFAPTGYHRELDNASVNIEDRIRGITL